jgi:hypothetical protein
MSSRRTEQVLKYFIGVIGLREMSEREPMLFKDWSEYMKQRQVMVSAVIFKNQGWYQWEIGHARIFGVLLWYYETKKQTSFKYSETLKKQGYRRTHNYRLLKTIVATNLLKKGRKGYYKLNLPEIKVIDKILSLIKELDMIGNKREVEKKSQSNAL